MIKSQSFLVFLTLQLFHQECEQLFSSPSSSFMEDFPIQKKKRKKRSGFLKLVQYLKTNTKLTWELNPNCLHVNSLAYLQVEQQGK